MSKQEDKNIENLQEELFLVEHAQKLANFGNWFWDIKKDSVRWSDVLYSIYGLNKQNFKATFSGYLERLHPDDKSRIRSIISDALAQQKDVHFEERIIRPSGEIRHLKSWGFVKTNDIGEPVKMIGACIDITESKLIEQSLKESQNTLKLLIARQHRYIELIEKQSERLNEISYIQSHVVRAPLAKIMGLVDLLVNHDNGKDDKTELFQYLSNASLEFDEVIQSIIQKTKL
ncbi:PAS domain-containing protein [Pelobium manganitolerans]|uniref:PAS domain-containing protein n=1 Tax=Pelobium manganitolerans TaxID=1842495 RepID=UPI003FA3C08D